MSILYWYLAMSLASTISAILGAIAVHYWGFKSPQYGFAMALSVLLGAIATMATL